jgi:hypothetical protein
MREWTATWMVSADGKGGDGVLTSTTMFSRNQSLRVPSADISSSVTSPCLALNVPLASHLGSARRIAAHSFRLTSYRSTMS